LRDAKKVIIVRDPKEVVKSYMRSVKHGVHKPIEIANWYDPEQIWIDKAKETGLMRDLEVFVDKWKAKTRQGIIIDKKHITENTKNCINYIEEYWSLDKTKRPINLDERRLSRDKGIIKGFILRNLGKYKCYYEKARYVTTSLWQKIR